MINNGDKNGMTTTSEMYDKQRTAEFGCKLDETLPPVYVNPHSILSQIFCSWGRPVEQFYWFCFCFVFDTSPPKRSESFYLN